MERFAKELAEYVECVRKYGTKEEVLAALIRTGVLNPDRSPKESIIKESHLE